MTNISDRYRTLADGFAARVAAVPADRWTSPSPCESWTARDVVGHVVETHGMFLGLVGETPAPGPSVDDDPVGAFAAARADVQAALDDPTRAGTEFEGFFGPTTLEAAIDRFISFDLLVHGWDLARAAGLDESMDPAEVHRAIGDAAAFGDALRSPGACGPALEPAPGADEQTQLLMFLGRRP